MIAAVEEIASVRLRLRGLKFATSVKSDDLFDLALTTEHPPRSALGE